MLYCCPCLAFLQYWVHSSWAILSISFLIKDSWSLLFYLGNTWWEFFISLVLRIVILPAGFFANLSFYRPLCQTQKRMTFSIVCKSLRKDRIFAVFCFVCSVCSVRMWMVLGGWFKRWSVLSLNGFQKTRFWLVQKNNNKGRITRIIKCFSCFYFCKSNVR